MIHLTLLLALAAPIAPPDGKKESFTVWGKEVGGVQAGIGFEPGQKRAHAPGETVNLVVRVRNVGKEKVSFQYLRHFFIENPPAVQNENGDTLVFKDATRPGPYKVEDAVLAPGKELELYVLSLALADKAPAEPRGSTLYGEGKYTIRYEGILGNSGLTSNPIKFPPELKDLATGKLELEVKKGANPK